MNIVPQMMSRWVVNARIKNIIPCKVLSLMTNSVDRVSVLYLKPLVVQRGKLDGSYYCHHLVLKNGMRAW